MAKIKISLLNFLDHSYARNITFAFSMGLLAVTSGSVSSALLLASTIFVIFLNPRIKPEEIWLEYLHIMKQIPIVVVFPLFYVVAILTSLQGEDFLVKSFQVAGSYWQLPFLVPFAIGLFYLSKDANFSGLFARGCRYGLITILPIAFIQVYGFEMRAEGLSRHASTLASICIVATAISIIKWPEDTKTDRLLAWLAFAAGTCIILLTFSRSMLIPLAVVFLIAGLYFVKSTHAKNTIYAMALIIMSCLVVAFLALFLSGKAPDLLHGISFEAGQSSERSFSERMNMNVSGLYAFAEHPLIGHGIKNVVEAANDASIRSIGTQTNYTYSHLHNAYLTYAVGGGLPLLLLLILTLMAPVLIMRSSSNLKFENDIEFFCYMIVFAFASLATVSTVFNNDQILTLYSIATIFVLVRYLQVKQGIENTRIPDLSIIAKGINPIGKAYSDSAN